MTAILLVEDDAEMLSLLGRFLPEEGYDVRVVGDMASTLRAVSEDEPDLILLDIVLGHEDGRDILKEIREISDVPAIFLTGRGLESDRIAGLKMGADDYIVKPFSLGELAARIESVLRRSGNHTGQHSIDSPNMKFGPLEINEQTHEVHLDGLLLELTAKEFSLLAFLATSPRQVFSREQLLEHVWASSPEWQNEATVTEHIRRLRLKDRDRP